MYAYRHLPSPASLSLNLNHTLMLDLLDASGMSSFEIGESEKTFFVQNFSVLK